MSQVAVSQGRWRVLGGMAVLLLATAAAYQPALRGAFIWDDDGHVTKPALRSAAGLYDIWFHVGATQQYYPLVHSCFWLQWHLWGDQPLGYHAVNIALHATAACLVLLVLRRLQVPGAFLAAAIFALHPVHVESVAWITEQKNTISTVFYLSAMLAYLRFDRTRGGWVYAFATILFVCALLSKTVTATLPAALLVIFWWQRGRISWRRDLQPLFPWFLLGVISGLATAGIERKLIGAEGAGFDLSFVQRGLLAGRVIAFYVGKLLWPARLAFIYPHWTIDPSIPAQWLGLAGVIFALAALCVLQRRWRAPLAAVLFFIGTLVPVLGFFNVYPFLFSYVADHFQYLASLGIVTLVSALIAIGIERLPASSRWTGHAACIALLVGLGTLSWRQCHIYEGPVVLYNATLQRNPGCWLAHNNLAFIANNAGQSQDALDHARQALLLRKDYPEAHCNLGIALYRTRSAPAAIAEFEEALRLTPDYFTAHNDLGVVLTRTGQPADAIRHFDSALRLRPGELQVYRNFANAYLAMNRPDAAARVIQKGIDAANAFGDVEAAREMSAWLADYRASLSVPTPR